MFLFVIRLNGCDRRLTTGCQCLRMLYAQRALVAEATLRLRTVQSLRGGRDQSGEGAVGIADCQKMGCPWIRSWIRRRIE